jgi:hypothetical protein
MKQTNQTKKADTRRRAVVGGAKKLDKKELKMK